MEHDKFKDNLSAYLDGELKGEELKALEAHLASCPACSRELAGLKQVSALFKKHAPEAVPHPLKEAVFGGLEKPAASSWLKPALAFATAAAALLVVFALPKFREGRAVFSPQLFQNSYYEESAGGAQGFGSRMPDMSSLQTAAPAAAGNLAAQAAGDGAAMEPAAAPKTEPEAEKKEAEPRYAAPAFRKAGAFGQARMARPAAGAAGGSALKKDAGSVGGYFASLSGAGSAARGAASAPFSGDSAEAENMPAAKPAAPAPQASGLSAAATPAAKAKAGRPAWIAALIKRYQKEPPGNPPYEIWRYSYKGRTVYFMPEQCCDQFSSLYDEAGGKLCAPDGGFAGTGDGRCPGFHEEKKDGELVWKDPRK